MLNPMTFPVEAFRFALLGKGAFSPTLAILSLTVTGLLLVSGILIFKRWSARSSTRCEKSKGKRAKCALTPSP